MWLATTMHPPSAGIRVPSIHVRDVAAVSVGLITVAAKVTAHPRRACTFLTATSPPL